MSKSLYALKPGDAVVRLLAGTVRQDLKVTEVTDERIICGAWEFDIRNGAEIDEYLGWDYRQTGSILRLPE